MSKKCSGIVPTSASKPQHSVISRGVGIA